MQLIFRKHGNVYYPSYLFTIFFITLEIATKEDITRKEEMQLTSIVTFAKYFFTSSEGIMYFFNYIEILFIKERYLNPIGDKVYVFNRNNVLDYVYGEINEEELLAISKVNGND